MIQGCGVCEEKSSKYKCPKCYIPFCSVACGQNHKVSTQCNPMPAERRDGNNSEEIELMTDDTVPSEVLAKLDDSTQLKNLLKNKNLQDTLRSLNSSSDPEPLLAQAMNDPDFQQFVQICLDLVEPQPTEDR